MKVNVALDRLPEFTSKPGFDPAGARRHDRARREPRRGRDVLPGGGCREARDAAVRRHLHPERVRPHARPRGQARDEHVHAVGAAHLERGAATTTSSRRTPTGSSRAWRQWLRASPTRCCTGRCSSPYDIEHEYGLVGGNIFHGELTMGQMFHARPAAGYADLRTPVRRPLPGRLRHPRRRRRDRRARPQRRAPGARRPQARPVARQGAAREEGLSVGELQAALPREHYVDDATHRVERERVLLREWTCIGRLDELGLTEPGSAAPAARAARGRRPARRVRAGHDHGRRHAARALQRLPPPRLAGGAGRAGLRRTGAVRREVAAVPVPLVDLRPRRHAAARTAHRGRDRCRRSPCTRWVRRRGAAGSG